MSTVNISITPDQTRAVDQLTKNYGFANRSEFFRAILRLIFNRPEILEKASIFPFVAPDTVDSKVVLASFKRTGKYSKEFLADLGEGLKESSYFKNS